MVARKPAPSRFKMLVNGAPVEVAGWESSAALGAAREESGAFASVMLLSGAVLAGGFASLDEAHRFNLAVAMEKKLFVGTPDLHEFYAKAGGLGAARALVEKIRKSLPIRERESKQQEKQKP
jgi:hypothetical protein